MRSKRNRTFICKDCDNPFQTTAKRGVEIQLCPKCKKQFDHDCLYGDWIVDGNVIHLREQGTMPDSNINLNRN